MSVALRPARPTDAGATGAILWNHQRETPWMPELYSGAETVAFCGTMIDRGWMTVVTVGGVVQGFLARDGAVLHALYVAPEAKGQGLGKRLLDDAKARVGRLRLSAFEDNHAARRFYRREGFVEAGRSDGAANDENLPDIAYVWPEEAPP